MAWPDAATQFLLSKSIVDDEEKNGCPLHELGD